MIREAQFEGALRALNDLLVTARKMAYERKRHDYIAGFLDAIEVLPMLIVREDDQTDDYRAALRDIAGRFPEAGVALQRFESEIPT